MPTRRGGCICNRSCPVVRHIVIFRRLRIRRSTNFWPCQGLAIVVHVARGILSGIEEYKWYREHYHTISMGCQSGQLMLHPRCRRPDLVKDFLAGPVFKFTCSILLNPARMVHLDILIELKDLNAEYGPIIADAARG